MAEQKTGLSIPSSLAENKLADAIRRKIEAGVSADPYFKLLLEKLVDPKYQEEKVFIVIKELIGKVLEGTPDANLRAYLEWLERNYSKIPVTPLSISQIGQFIKSSTDLYVRDQEITGGREGYLSDSVGQLMGQTGAVAVRYFEQVQNKVVHYHLSDLSPISSDENRAPQFRDGKSDFKGLYVDLRVDKILSVYLEQYPKPQINEFFQLQLSKFLTSDGKADCCGVSLENKNLTGSRFDEADFRRASFRYSTLKKVSFWQTKLEGADINHAVGLKAKQLTVAIVKSFKRPENQQTKSLLDKVFVFKAKDERIMQLEKELISEKDNRQFVMQCFKLLEDGISGEELDKRTPGANERLNRLREEDNQVEENTTGVQSKPQLRN